MYINSYGPPGTLNAYQAGHIFDWGVLAEGAAGAAAAPAIVRRGYEPVPEVLPNETEHRRKLATASNALLRGKQNIITTVTLDAGAASTTLTDVRITTQNFLGFMPQTANAAAELATLYLASTDQNQGSAVLTHANNSQTDRTFTVLIIG